MLNFQCATCGERHFGPSMAFGPDAPESWDATPAASRLHGSILTEDQCILNDEFYFIRGCLDVPIREQPHVFRWLVWVSVSRSDFERMEARREVEGRENEPPYFGWLNSVLPGYPATFNLKVNVHTRPLGERPLVEFEPTEHRLPCSSVRVSPLSTLIGLQAGCCMRRAPNKGLQGTPSDGIVLTSDAGACSAPLNLGR